MNRAKVISTLYAFDGSLTYPHVAYESPDGSYQYQELELGDKQVVEREPPCPNAPTEHGRGCDKPEELSSEIKGRKHADLLWGLGYFAVTDRALELFQNGGITGFDPRPVNIERKPKSCKIDRLWYLYITGKALPDMKKCGIHLEYECPLCGSRRYTVWDHRKGLSVLEGSWDGSDLFRMYAPEDYERGKQTLYGYVFATQKVLDLVRDNDLRPACFVDIRKMT